MSWKEEVISRARELGREVFEHEMGVGIEFADGGDAFWILPGEVTSTVEVDGEVDVGMVFEAYERIGRVRSDVIHAMAYHLGKMGWRVSKRTNASWNLEKGRIYSSWRLGAFLTGVARDTGNVAATIEAIFTDHWIQGPSRAQIEFYLALPPLVVEVDGVVRDAAPVVLDSSPRGLPDVPPLLELTPALVREMDVWAKSVLEKYLARSDVTWDYRNRDVYDPAIDIWVTFSDWVRLAEVTLSESQPDPCAIVILLDAGDPRGDALARRIIAGVELDYESWDVMIEIAWRCRHAFPEAARAWFVAKAWDDVPFWKVRALLGDPVALRQQCFDWDEDQLDPATPPVERQAEVHEELLIWAKTEHVWSFPQDKQLRTAREMGWTDVAVALEENPFMLAGLLTIARREDQFDEPGMLGAGSFLLIWSRLLPSAFLARLLLTGWKTDLVVLAEAASRESIRRRPELAGALASSLEAYRSWQKDLQPALAIAWTRCRNAGRDGWSRACP